MSYNLTLGATPEVKIAGVAGAMFIWMIPLALLFFIKRKVRA